MILVTGAAGFIGFHVAKRLLERGESVLGVDSLNDYYPLALKQARLSELENIPGFSFAKMDLSENSEVTGLATDFAPKKIIHLAAQAGVRYSLENPHAYVRANLIAHANILELAHQVNAENTVYASSSSVYGGNDKTPFHEDDKTDDQVSFYGATKKSNEMMSNAYSRLHGLSMTGLRFFTVYGPYGRPDMAYWSFAESILRGRPIEIFNNGEMSRDFTFIDDIVDGVVMALDRPASLLGLEVPHRVYNLGNDRPEKLMDLVNGIERVLERKAHKVFKPMQKGDVKNTWANIERARRELDYTPKVNLERGLSRFAQWFNSWENQ
jgi:UDP-glucuronate 4-epimerase